MKILGHVVVAADGSRLYSDALYSDRGAVEQRVVELNAAGAGPFVAGSIVTAEEAGRDRIAHVVTRVDHRGRLEPVGGGEAEYGEVHWHVACHNSACEWRPEGREYEGCDRGGGFTEDEAAELVRAHIEETSR